MFTARLSKLSHSYLPQQSDPVHYSLTADPGLDVDCNALIGHRISFDYLGLINCIHCDRKISKSFNRGYCYPCFKKLARCDLCIVKPVRCHFDKGTCREEEWALSHCMQPHIVYLANTSGLKVGITRESNLLTRWVDQGAVQTLAIMRVQTRQQAGYVEELFKSAKVNDITDWRRMLGAQIQPLDLYAERDRLRQTLAGGMNDLQQRFGDRQLQWLEDSQQQGHRLSTAGRCPVPAGYRFGTYPAGRGTIAGHQGAVHDFGLRGL